MVTHGNKLMSNALSDSIFGVLTIDVINNTLSQLEHINSDLFKSDY
jgi:hypothetical protein